MRVLYAAIDQTVPGTTGGSVHVTSVAEGLAALGHEVHVLTGAGNRGFPQVPVTWHALTPPLGSRYLRTLRAGTVQEYAARINADVVMERYYNFGGEGLLAARRLGIPGVLEVNAPVVDYPGSPKQLLDRALLIQPLRRWRDWQCRTAALIVTPSAAIVPKWVPRDRIVELEWGADTTRFHPDAAESSLERGSDRTIAVFAGAFRAWHGAIHLVNAVKRLRDRGRHDIGAVFIGDGPERARVEEAARGLDGVQFRGAVPHDRMPSLLASADIGVAPFDVAAHPPLMLDFYWSPLKIFEYMASGLPVVAPDIPRLRRIVTQGVEGILYDAGDPEGLAHALEQAADPARGAALGRAARSRVVREFGWDVHCRRLADAIEAARSRR